MPTEINQTLTVIIATHKQYRMPADDIYLPLHVGAELQLSRDADKADLGYQKDNTGENISSRNSGYSELTGLYWAWKNVDSDYIGLVHYRRHFCFQRKRSKDPFDSIMTSREGIYLTKRYKSILPRKRYYVIESLYSHYAHTHIKEHLDLMRKIIRRDCADYITDYDVVMRQKSGYMFNMMILRRQLLDDYCSWLFPLLFKLEKRVKSDHLSPYQGRLYGRVSEILFNVWLRNQIRTGRLQKDEIVEVPLINMEGENWMKKGCAFLQAKFLGKKYKGSF